MFVHVLSSVLADLAMLVDAYGAFGVVIFSAPTVAILVWSQFQ